MLKYTDEVPTASGWYWLKKRGEKPEVVQVVAYKSPAGRSWMRIGDMSAQNRHEFKKRNWKWAGPIEEPEGSVCRAAEK